MLNEKKVITMTKLASYEETEGKKDAAIGRFYRGDYIGIQIIKSIIYVTIAAFLIGAMALLYQFEDILSNFYKYDLVAMGKRFLFIFAVVLVVYAVVSYAIYSYHYSRARRKQKIYAAHLKQLGSMYDRDAKK